MVVFDVRAAAATPFRELGATVAASPREVADQIGRASCRERV
jgi:hypothetical protein